jgi:hypothetical protein
MRAGTGLYLPAAVSSIPGTLRSLPAGAWVFVYIPQAGYVGVGITTGEACMFDDAVPAVDGQQQWLAELPLTGGYHHTAADSEETAEYVVPVDWISTRTREYAIRQKGLFANQNSACKLRNRFTFEGLYQAFGLDEISPANSGYQASSSSAVSILRRSNRSLLRHPHLPRIARLPRVMYLCRRWMQPRQEPLRGSHGLQQTSQAGRPRERG